MTHPEQLKKPHPFLTAKIPYTLGETDVMNLILYTIKKESLAQKKKNLRVGKALNIVTKYDGVYADQMSSVYSIPRKDILPLMTIKGRRLSDMLFDSCNGIQSKPLAVKDTETGVFITSTIVTSAVWNGETLKIVIPNKIKNIMLDYSLGFVETDLKLLFELKSVYEKRILEWISRFKNDKNKGYYRIKIKTMLESLAIPITENAFEREKVFSDFSSLASFRHSTLTRPMSNIIKKSNGTWVCHPSHKSGIKIESSGKKATEDSYVVFMVDYIEPETDVTPDVEAVDDVTDELVQLSLIVDAWRRGTPPTGTQALEILLQISDLEQRGLLTKAVFEQLYKNVPPLR